MDSWQVAQNYLVAVAIGGAVGGYYYYTAKQRKPNRTGSLNAITSRRSDTDLRGRHVRPSRDTSASSSRQTSSSAAAKKRKVRTEPVQSKLDSVTVPEIDVDDKPTKESDMSAAQFAKQMQQARQGADLSTSKSNESRVKTVKARASTNAFSNTFDEPAEPAESTNSYNMGDVSDMLEPVAPPPSTLRITPSAEPQKTKTPRQAKQEVVETKKQRQNRKKAEERKALREEEEKDRRVLEEKQRRTARQARGEPAKNGIPVSRAPLNNAWEQRNANSAAAVQASDSGANGAHGVMLDTFDAESTSSSNGGHGASTAATSTTSGEQSRWDISAEEEQIAAAIKESGDEAGWTTVSAPVKGKKKSGLLNEASSGAITPVKEHGKQAASNDHLRTGAYAALDTASSE